jgi:hypothetical protein
VDESDPDGQQYATRRLAYSSSATASQFGVDPNEVATSSGIDLITLRNPENIIPLLPMRRLTNICSTATGCEHFGLLVGKSGTLATLD